MELKGHLLYYPEGKHDINLNNYVQKSQLNDAIKSKVDSITKTTYADLKNLRDNSQLVPGNLYRITDYQCTTTQENTRSAGHQFDIVLLALSENKLAEEGWAMMHDNIYDVTFADGVTKKCWIYEDKSSGLVYITDISAMLCINDATTSDVEIDEENKTAICGTYESTELNSENPTYNYFQNSNLSAWKVWYCLDNDTARFAWADDSVDNGYVENIYMIIEDTTIYYVRNSSKDTVYKGDQYYCWENINNASGLFFTISDNPEIGDYIYDKDKGGSMNRVGSVEHVTRHEGTGLPNGRGVIYRLIDEWNNDVAYDFKNIQYVRKLTDGHINAQGRDTWCYTFNAYFNGDIYDYSIVSAIWKDDEDDVQPVMNNTIYSVKSDNGGSKKLNDFVFNVDGAEPDVYSVVIKNNLFLTIRDGGNFEGTGLMHSIFLDTRNNIIYNDNANGIIYQNKKVVFENIT